MLICGLDEVGMGAMAGPMYTVAAVFDREFPPEGVTIKDSKKMTSSTREIAFYGILPITVAVSLGYLYPQEINKIGMSKGWQLCCQRALTALKVRPELLLVDGITAIRDTPFTCKQKVIVKGDDKYWQISAAAIIAKVLRDNLMKDLHREFPWYAWGQNKGYGGAKNHKQGVQKYGPHSELHRTSWKWKGVW